MCCPPTSGEFGIDFARLILTMSSMIVPSPKPWKQHNALIMKTLPVLLAACIALPFLLVSSAVAAEKAPKLTCCQEANVKKEECKHKCCITAHKNSKSCEKCNPNKEDLKLKKKDDKKGPSKP
jgi:hypothetical protein